VSTLDFNRWLDSRVDRTLTRTFRATGAFVRAAHALSGTGDEMMFSS